MDFIISLETSNENLPRTLARPQYFSMALDYHFRRLPFSRDYFYFRMLFNFTKILKI